MTSPLVVNPPFCQNASRFCDNPLVRITPSTTHRGWLSLRRALIPLIFVFTAPLGLPSTEETLTPATLPFIRVAGVWETAFSKTKVSLGATLLTADMLPDNR